MFRAIFRVSNLILACCGTFFAATSCFAPSWNVGYSARRFDQYFIGLDNRRVWIGSAERYAFQWRDPNQTHDDLNIAGPAARVAFREKWSIGRFWGSPMFWSSPAQPGRFAAEYLGIDPLNGSPMNYPDHYLAHGFQSPTWVVSIALLLCPALYLASSICKRIAIRGRIRLGRCIQCNYDVRASTDRCPECGKSICLPAR